MIMRVVLSGQGSQVNSLDVPATCKINGTVGRATKIESIFVLDENDQYFAGKASVSFAPESLITNTVWPLVFNSTIIGTCEWNGVQIMISSVKKSNKKCFLTYCLSAS